MSVIVKGGGGENVTPEVTAQTPMISQILSNLGFTADSAIGTNKQKLQTNNANLAKIEDYLPHGTYVWKKLTAQGGDFIDFVVSDQSTAYPDGGTQDGYWYEKFNEKKIEVVSDSVNFYIDEVYGEFQKTIAHGLGRKPDYYGITSAIPGSDTSLRKVSISADDTNIIFDLRYNSSYRDATFEWFAITVN